MSDFDMETILRIEEDVFTHNADSYDGFVIITDKQSIKIGIGNYQSCCESWGYLMLKDDKSDFIGAKIISLTITDTALKTCEVLRGVPDGQIMFVNLETDKGLFQLVAYNEHNGYYGHEVVVVSNQLNHKSAL